MLIQTLIFSRFIPFISAVNAAGGYTGIFYIVFLIALFFCLCKTMGKTAWKKKTEVIVLLFLWAMAGLIILSGFSGLQQAVCALLLAACTAAFFQDLLWYYFSAFWLWMLGICTAAGLLLPVPVFSRAAGLLYALVMLPFYRSEKTGSADVWAAAGMGIVLGFERMSICMLAACLSGFAFVLFHRICRRFRQKEKEPLLIPFVSCLCTGFAIALFRGWTLFALVEKAFLFR